MGKVLFDTRQTTIERLREFLHESVNLEPELEQFIKTLIFSLEFSGQTNATTYHPSSNGQTKVQH